MRDESSGGLVMPPLEELGRVASVKDATMCLAAIRDPVFQRDTVKT
jgi:hypothetical protein